MAETMNCNFNNTFAPWMNNASFNAWWSYSYVNNSAFYARIPAQFQMFMRRYVQNSLWWNDGWVPYFHNAHDGIFSTGLAGAIVRRLGDKVFGSKLYFRNDSPVEVENPENVKANPSLLAFGEWAERTRFNRAVRRAVGYALAAGTAALKVNRNRKGDLWVDAWRFDKFFPQINGDGSVEACTFYIMLNIPFERSTARDAKTVYTLEERRYFGDYTRMSGEVMHDAPLVEYQVHKMYGTVTNGEFVSSECSERVCWRDLPKSVKKYISTNFAWAEIDKPVLLPFDDWLGVELVYATNGIDSLPDLPFGEGVLHKIIPHLQAFDYAFSASCTDMYLGRGRVIVPKGIGNGSAGQANAGLNNFLYEKVEYVNPDDQKPLPLQFEVRSAEWRAQYENLLNLISIDIGVSPSTLASFLQDSSTKTAREISTQENETMQFIVNTREVIEPAINSVINRIRLYMGLEDKIAVRWGYPGMENPYINAETLSMAINGGFMSRWKAIQRFNFDDNEVQLAAEYKRIMQDQESASFGNSMFADSETGGGYFGDGGTISNDAEAFEPTGDSDRGRTDRDQGALA